MISSWIRYLCLAIFVLALGACSRVSHEPTSRSKSTSNKGNEVVLFATNLLDIRYKAGGKTPETGFDCSGLVGYVYQNVLKMKVSGSAADIAKQGKAINRSDLQPGDLVFFNTMNKPFSHVGIFIGDERFIHAPSTNGRVRIDQMKTGYFAERYHAAHAYF